MNDDNAIHHDRKRRATCQKCSFPSRTCICPALPPAPLQALFRRCRIIVLQHPHELRRKNRSMPLVDLCMFGNTNHDMHSDQDFIMKTIVGRGLGPERHADVINILNDTDEVIVLVFPGPNAMDLEQGIQLAEKKCEFENKDGDTRDSTLLMKKITLLFIDATWKHAREMNAKLTSCLNCKHWIQVQLVPNVSENDRTQAPHQNDAQSNSERNIESTRQTSFDFVQRRFQIRAPPSPNHLSTAECLAWVVSRVEKNPLIYETISKVLDHMVRLWKDNVEFHNEKKRAMSQKPLEIKKSDKAQDLN